MGDTSRGEQCCAKGCTIAHPVGGAHKCAACDRSMHVFFGVHLGEGFDSNSIGYCLSTDKCQPPEDKSDQTTTESDTMQEDDVVQATFKQYALSNVNGASSIMMNKLTESKKKKSYPQTVLSKVKDRTFTRYNLTDKDKGIIVRAIKKVGYSFDNSWKENYRKDLVKEAVRAARESFGVSLKKYEGCVNKQKISTRAEILKYRSIFE
ncbi:hypothetical protein SARC_00181 [Sphaeroforma arctica JP610]|uniref:Uncharacterized protein n=1 Tax=Sphaeroforma arctica JP610 TaxID=667725 RepID=A0A0L0GFE2_9EUKA|nr:hypothetical protein SARC_00181 [Sphaeroforma arctica JP610]KNC87747.1 hypothetical protein SARC_00181 [Sphaeroforma arctica JP610]|eukprot:XP_014161649.1 hypothetical protein SARC_00181 [Sphaeroforma arctica JP610]